MINRREFFRVGLRGSVDAVARGAGALGKAIVPPEQPVARLPFLRPPGALPEAEFRSACTSCDDCVKACPKWAIRKAGAELGKAVEGTPIIIPEEQPCWMCTDMPCIPACETGALQPLERISDARMGVVRVDLETCYSAIGSICETCAERCPVRPKPVRVAMGQAPVIDTDTCTGCGVCSWLCPADAMEIVPRALQSSS